MSNLIITIISIALVAVAALMGAYYGGTAFLQGQAKAQANALINQGQQIAAAWQVYAANNGGSRNITVWSSLVPTYLQSTPVNDFEPASPVFSGWNVIHSGDDAALGDMGNADSVIAEINSRELCEAIHQVAAGPDAVLVDNGGGSGFGGGVSLLGANIKFDCVYYETDLNGLPAYFFVYRAF